MRYGRYGGREFPAPAGAGRAGRPGVTRTAVGGAGAQHGAEATLALPEGVTESEAMFLLDLFARLKEKRFGRVEVTMREGSVTNIELVEKVDRRLFQALGS